MPKASLGEVQRGSVTIRDLSFPYQHFHHIPESGRNNTTRSAHVLKRDNPELSVLALLAPHNLHHSTNERLE